MSFQPPTPRSLSQPSPLGPSELSSGQIPNPTATAPTASATLPATLPTPAHSVNGSLSQPHDMSQDSALTSSPFKRKRTCDDVGGRQQKKALIEKGKLDIEDLHLDVGTKYLLCRTPHLPSLPRMSEDLFAMFGLEDLAIEVAREKPNGEKNALRKTYKGHIKRLGVIGHFDAVKKDTREPDGFMAMLQLPEEEWNILHVSGRDIADGLSSTALTSLGRAMTMAKGPVSKAVWDSSVLGDLAPLAADTKPKISAPSIPAHPTLPATARPKPPSLDLVPQPGVQPKQYPQQSPLDPARPKRNVKKRGYGDNSYEGYADGFPDDEATAETGYSTGEGEERGGVKRRKKNIASPTPPFPEAIRQPSYGPGMVGA